MARVLSVLAAVLFGLGVVVGLVPVSAGGTSCGAGFWPSDDARVQDFTNAMIADSQGTSMQDFGGIGGAAAACTDLLSVVRIPAFALIVVSAGVGIASAVVRRRGSTAG